MEITTSMYKYSYGTLYSFSFLTTYAKLQIHVKKSTIAVNTGTGRLAETAKASTISSQDSQVQSSTTHSYGRITE